MRIRVTTTRKEISVAQAARFLDALSLLQSAVAVLPQRPNEPGDAESGSARAQFMEAIQGRLPSWRQLEQNWRELDKTRPPFTSPVAFFQQVSALALSALVLSALSASGYGPRLQSLTAGSLDTVIEGVIDSVLDFFSRLLPKLVTADLKQPAEAVVNLLPNSGEDEMSQASRMLAARGAAQMAATLHDMGATSITITKTDQRAA